MARGTGKSSRGTGVSGSRVQAFFLHGSREIATPRLALMLSVIVLTVIGIVMVYSSSTIEAINQGANPKSYMVSQLLYALLAVVACMFIARSIPYYRWLTRLLDAFWLASLLLLILTAAIGTASLGAQRWLVLGPVHFQPSEFAKVVFVLVMSRIMYQLHTQESDVNQLGTSVLVYVVAPLLLLYISQSDLGTTLICVVGILTVAWLGDVPMKPFLATVAVLFALGLLAVFAVGYRSDRLSFTNPEANYEGSGYQLARSLYAFGEGGLFGVGLGNSTEKYLYLPEAETDFIFAIIGEELGLVGALLVIVLFVVVLLAGLDIARKAPDLFGTMIAAGCTVVLVFQAFLNIACVIGILPTTGKPLPFISSGGSSLVGSYLLVGIILSVSFASGSDSGVYHKRRQEFKVVHTAARRGHPSSSGGSRRNGGRR